MQMHLQRGRTAALPSVLALVLTAALAAAWTTAGAAAPGRGAVAPAQELALVLRPQTARQAPARTSKAVELVGASRPITGQRTALPVLEHRTAADGKVWLRVRLPGRPNGHTGWIERRGTARTVTTWRLVIATSSRLVTVYRDGRPVRSFRAIVGSPSTPTPHGAFFVEESIALRAGDVGAPFALALSARSNVLQQFAGGPGHIGLHGLANVGGSLATAVSHGCVRVDGEAMLWLAHRIGPGVPVTIA
jgi:lipoprotein-anchoring transpeptidase ErfK/SrfK